jgi:predicted NBD/HSP70 family sugar kinase
MLTDLGRAIAQLDPDRVVVIGRGSPAELDKLPPRVRAACTLRQWIDRLRRGGTYEDVQKWWKAARQALLSDHDRQARLSSFAESSKEAAE